MVDSLKNVAGVLGALKALQMARRDMAGTEDRVSSGITVNSASDDAVRFQSAASMRDEGSSLKSVTLSLGRAKSVSDMAVAGAEQVSKLLIKMRDTATAAMSNDLSPQQRQIYSQQFQDMRQQLSGFISTATFDGSNLLDGSKPNGVTFIADAEAGQTLFLAGRDLRVGGPVVTLSTLQTLDTPLDATVAFNELTQSIANVGDQLSRMSAENKQVQAQMSFVSRLADALATGVGRLVDADLAAESAQVQALQLKQELSAQAIGIANSAPEALLALFRPA